MYKFIKQLRILSLLLCLPLAGCLDVDQELWVYGDGSGRMKIELGLHGQTGTSQGNGNAGNNRCDGYFEEKSILEKHEGVESVERKSYIEGGVFYCVADIKVSDFTLLQTVQEASLRGSAIDANRNAFQSEFTLTNKDGHGYFRLHVRNQAADPDKHKLLQHVEQFTNVLTGSMMTGRYWSVTLHTPDLLDANGTKNEDSKTATWRVPLYDLLVDEHYAFDMQATFEVNKPWYKKIWNWMI